MRFGARHDITAGCAGFTLLEMLVALTILALITAVGVGGLRILGRAQAHRAAASAALAQKGAAYDVLHNQLGRALPLDWGSSDNPLVAFEGDAQQVRFVDAQPLYQPMTGLILWQIDIEDEPSGGSRLIVRRKAFKLGGPGFESLASATPQLLLASPARLRFAYFGAVERDAPPTWRDSWRANVHLPQAIRLARDDDGASPPLIVLPLDIDTPARCSDGKTNDRGCR